MKKYMILLLLLGAACRQVDFTGYVDPNIGGVSILLTTKKPTVHRPHSMVRVFPVTEPGLGDRYLSDRIYGFALNMPSYRGSHLTQLMPVPGDLQTAVRESASLYDHDLEEVHPWYHRVWLEDHEVSADWTATEHSVIYRFDFQQDIPGHLIFRSRRNAEFRIRDSLTLEGWEETRGMRQYFYAVFSGPCGQYGMLDRDSIFPGERQISGAGSGAWVSYSPPHTPVEVRIGISYIDVAQARENLLLETEGKNFEKLVDESQRIWADALNSIRVSGGTERQKRIFYTSLYRSLERMVDISEYGRYYSGYDDQVHTAGNHDFYVDDWLWDTFRSQHPLLSILEPERQAAVRLEHGRLA